MTVYRLSKSITCGFETRMVVEDSEARLIVGICSLILWIKINISSFKQAQYTPNNIRVEEDSKIKHMWNYPHKSDIMYLRWKGVMNNDNENLPYGLIIWWLNALLLANGLVYSVCIIVYTICRIAHTFCYVYGLQPHRFLCFQIGKVLEGIGMMNILIQLINQL